MANLLFIPLVLIVGYLLLVRPQQQRVRRQQQLLSSIRVGDEVVTAGGMVGRVESLDDDRVWLELAPGTTVQFLRQAIARRLEAPEGDEDATEGATFEEDGAAPPDLDGTHQDDGGTEHDEGVDRDRSDDR